MSIKTVIELPSKGKNFRVENILNVKAVSAKLKELGVICKVGVMEDFVTVSDIAVNLSADEIKIELEKIFPDAVVWTNDNDLYPTLSYSEEYDNEMVKHDALGIV